jgi:hypothetical protein
MNRIFSFALVAATGLLLAGCYEMDETIANVYVVRDEGGVEVPVSDAEVRLYALGSLDQDFVGEPRFDTTQVTTNEGFTSFNFSSFYVAGQAGFAVLDVECTKGALTGTGLIKIVEMETSEVTVVME